MSKLLQRLSDASKSGVYRVPGRDAILEATKGSALRVVLVVLAPGAGKAQIMAQLSKALEFPAWFGGNWDALEDCLTDLSWSAAPGHVILIEGAAHAGADDLGVLEDLFASAASHWAGRGRTFFAIFVGGRSSLPALYRERE